MCIHAPHRAMSGTWRQGTPSSGPPAGLWSICGEIPFSTTHGTLCWFGVLLRPAEGGEQWLPLLLALEHDL